MSSDTPRTLEQRIAQWAQQPGAFVTVIEWSFIAAMRDFARRGVGYGWMQQVIEWEWQSKGSGSWGPESHERDLAAMTARAEAAERDAERLREALGLVCDLASQEWQEADGSRRGATDNSGARLWFIGGDVMQAAVAAREGK